MTLDYAKQLAEKAEQDLIAAQDDQTAAQQALAGAKQAHYAAVSKTSMTEADRDAINAAEHELLLARNRVTGAGFAVRRAEQVVASTKARVVRLTPHAKLLQQIEDAITVVQERDAAARRRVVRFEDELRAAIREVQEGVEAAGVLLAQLPGDCRLDVTYPIHVSIFAVVDYRDPGLLRWLSLVHESAFREEPPAPPPPLPWKKKGVA